ncbi:MAG: DUF58 domain-containing protein [Candidatus Sungiibacteriota bacterium]|uniref:DUF58 domain-containing protein n=1 Tax=Candidatus Sungiibacteriota bacterium TaxID=2750080 RepID=A0A7T5RIW5_9BACT|nr:MAG: DUF58 domain-containing protein [Candidatus Sungbacteria bacterium]
MNGFCREMFLRSLQEFELSEPAFRVWTLTFGEHRSKQIGEGIEFKEYRPYEPGHDVRAIDIAATLRTGKTLMRINLTEEKVRYVIVFDDSPSLNYYGMREAALLALGCYALSAVKERDPLRLAVVNGDKQKIFSEPLYTAEEVIPFLLRLWDEPGRISGQATSLTRFSGEVMRLPQLVNTRVLFVSDFLFSDAGVKFTRRGEAHLEGYGALKQFTASVISSGESTDLAFLGVAPCWKEFLDLRGFVPFTDSEDQSRGLVRFTRKNTKKFTDRGRKLEELWKRTALALNIPMVWIHAGGPDVILNELARLYTP